MGFFSKLKNMVTGGGATVKILNDKITNGTYNLAVEIEANDDVAANKVYYQIKEEYKTVTQTIGYKKNEDGTRTNEIVLDTHKDISLKIIKEGTLKEKWNFKTGEKSRIEVTIDLPSVLSVNYSPELKNPGEYRLQCLVGIDTAGNDPDSGWVKLQV